MELGLNLAGTRYLARWVRLPAIAVLFGLLVSCERDVKIADTEKLITNEAEFGNWSFYCWGMNHPTVERSCRISQYWEEGDASDLGRGRGIEIVVFDERVLIESQTEPLGQSELLLVCGDQILEGRSKPRTHSRRKEIFAGKEADQAKQMMLSNRECSLRLRVDGVGFVVSTFQTDGLSRAVAHARSLILAD
jgi:hypothetical protein